MPNIVIENKMLRLTVSEDGIAKSLICLATGEECLKADEEISLFSVTQDRPFNNEVKLAHPNKRTTYQANALRLEGNRFIVGFEIAPYEAVIEMKLADRYLTFTLVDFICPPEAYGGLRMTPPPVAELRLLQLPVKNRKYFGEWLNVSWDEKAGVCVLAASPFARIESERRVGCRIMTADAVRGIKLKNNPAALICAPGDRILDCIADLEEDYDLPRGVESRRSDLINASIYWTAAINLDNVDEHIAYAKAGGFRIMVIYYTAICKEIGSYGLNGNYDYRPDYPNGKEDVIALVNKIKAAGIIPGLHFLQTHIGLKSRYVVPHADHRLGKTRIFTLAKAIEEGDTELFVEQNPEDTVMDERCRILQFGGELISYESYVTEYPYRFIGCQRGALSTELEDHPKGQMGGILDVSEFGGGSCYVDQNTDLQDEVAEKIAEIFNCGFRTVYFDGSEGTNIPYEIHVPNAQYRVWKKLTPATLFTEGAAKAHFSWHFLSGGNAFDVFGPAVFKEKIDQYPAEEAPRMRQDFTRLNFGWWGYWAPGGWGPTGIQADMYEYGTSRAAGWDCPITVQTRMDNFKIHPRTADIFEVIRRWEDVRARKWLTTEQKLMLRELGQEHHLLINEKGEYELVPITMAAVPDETTLRAFVFERNGEAWAAYWHPTGEGTLKLNIPAAALMDELNTGETVLDAVDGAVTLPACKRRYIRTKLTAAELAAAFAGAVVE